MNEESWHLVFVSVLFVCGDDLNKIFSFEISNLMKNWYLSDGDNVNDALIYEHDQYAFYYEYVYVFLMK